MTESSPPTPGSRVVLRYRLPAGSTHSMSDIVGELLSLDPVAVRDRHGRIVTVTPAGVVALKRVPPSPPRKSR